MDKTNEEIEVEETLDLPEIEEGQEDTTDWKAEAQKLREKAIASRERTKMLKQQLADAKKVTESKVDSQPKAGELDETQMDYLDLKGISEDEDIKVIESVMKRTGDSLRSVLKDDYVISKLAANKTKREVQDATPSNTKRTGSGSSNNLEAAIAKFEASGKLPEDYDLATKVVNALSDRDNPNKPSWHK